ncbi:hypothetical protein [Enterovirga sp. CN4-39]|uniref:hypothetical protein n=1 Tax=Enterovirga sp. CN4-39 TaxID=3400910 RepID=UPI003C084AEC
MNKVISVAAATTLGIALMAGAPGAQASSPSLPNADALAAAVPNAEYTQHRGRRHGHYRSHRGRNAAGAAAAVGIAGALIGGAIAAQQRRDYYYDRPYGAYGYYGPGYDYYDPY